MSLSTSSVSSLRSALRKALSSISCSRKLSVHVTRGKIGKTRLSLFHWKIRASFHIIASLFSAAEEYVDVDWKRCDKTHNGHWTCMLTINWQVRIFLLSNTLWRNFLRNYNMTWSETLQCHWQSEATVQVVSALALFMAAGTNGQISNRNTNLNTL